mmetsp:Transcript_5588/g.17853  ORF Transcript_5588/g.17853 Transcript_5588/m.17853 type:complete len:314 (-) Transcript_5588:36-977(-)
MHVAASRHGLTHSRTMLPRSAQSPSRPSERVVEVGQDVVVPELVGELHVGALELQHVDLAGLVQRAEADPVLLVRVSVVEVHNVLGAAPRIEAKLLALLGVHHGVVERHDEGQAVEGSHVGLVGGVLGVPGVLETGEEGGALEVLRLVTALPVAGERQLGGVRVGLEDGADPAGHRGRAGPHALLGTTQADKVEHGRVVVLLDVGPDDQAALADADRVEALGQLRIRPHRLGELVHLVLHQRKVRRGTVRNVWRCRIRPWERAHDALDQRLHATGVPRIAEPVHEDHGAIVRSGRRLLCQKHLRNLVAWPCGD